MNSHHVAEDKVHKPGVLPVTLGGVSPRIVLPPSDAEWQALAREDFEAALEAAQCALGLLVRVVQGERERELARAILTALVRIELAAKRTRL
ncbi:MAG TPA: hypothetical protein VNL18_10605 [Gemmatimonadales bacterium]|nr:hypothetical protein [Gemmatimonadales bacterium]